MKVSNNFNKFYYDADSGQTRPATGSSYGVKTDNTMNRLDEECMTITPMDGTSWSSGGGFIGDSDRLLLGLRLSPTDTRGVPEFPPPL